MQNLMYIEFYKETENVREREHVWECTTTYSEANIALMSVKENVLRSDL